MINAYSPQYIYSDQQDIDISVLSLYNSFEMTTAYLSEKLRKKIEHMINIGFFKSISDLIQICFYCFFLEYYKDLANTHSVLHSYDNIINYKQYHCDLDEIKKIKLFEFIFFPLYREGSYRISKPYRILYMSYMINWLKKKIKEPANQNSNLKYIQIMINNELKTFKIPPKKRD